MKHVFLIDPLEKLNIKKDSSLLMALTLKASGKEVYLLFVEDFYWANSLVSQFEVHTFSGELENNSFYLKDLRLDEKISIPFLAGDTLHMRLDPPFDTRYLRILWALGEYERKGIKVVNSAKGILLHNEKLRAYREYPSAPQTYIGSSVHGFKRFFKDCQQHQYTSLIFKPLDLFQGMGVEKISMNEGGLEKRFQEKVKENGGAIVVQPFLENIYQGEWRTLFYNGKHLGTILKTPPQGSFLANIAQGAKYQKTELPPAMLEKSIEIAKDLLHYGVDFIAFDILGEFISEVNITCPGLLVEVSLAHQKNLALEMFNQ